jgi:leucyl/phenylalanyl-tRNA--protein transferase
MTSLRLTPELLVEAYRRGIFPMAEPESGRVGWYSPDPRAILPFEGFRVAASLARTLRAGRFELTTDRAFERVMRECAAPRPGREHTWIDASLVAAYTALHRRGQAHSVEAWLEGELVGGLYGVHLGAAFFGESMFHRPERGGRDASKVCLAALVRALAAAGFLLHDVQYVTPHLERFGAVEIPRARYLALLARALERECPWPEDPGAAPQK